MLKWLYYKLSRYYHNKNEQDIKRLIKKHILELKQKWPGCYVEVTKISHEWFPSISSWEVYKTKEYEEWVYNVHKEYWDAGFCEVFWGCSSGITGDNWRVLDA